MRPKKMDLKQSYTMQPIRYLESSSTHTLLKGGQSKTYLKIATFKQKNRKNRKYLLATMRVALSAWQKVFNP